MSATRTGSWSSSTGPIKLLDNRLEIRRPIPPVEEYLR